MKLLVSALLVAPTSAFSVSSPKEALAKLVVENLKTDAGKLSPALREEKKEKFTQLCDDLWDEYKGFSSDTVEGEWTSVLNLPGKKSRKQQSLVGNRIEKAGTTMGDFVGNEIRVTAPTPRENGKIEAVLHYNSSPKNFSVNKEGKIVLRRIDCDNVKATLKYRFLPKVHIPFFKRKGGWLDFIYLDDDVRVTRGNRGGTFVHMRKDYLDKIMKEH